MWSIYLFAGFCLGFSYSVQSKEIPLPIFMQNTPADVRVKFTEIISRADLQPIQRRQLIDQLIATQPASVQQAYQKYNQLLDEHKKKFGISLEQELEKARLAYIQKNGHA